MLIGALLGALPMEGKAWADYNVKATEASLNTLVSDGKCNLAEAIASVNNGSPLYGCSGTGKKIVLEGTGAHYKVPTAGVSIGVSGVEITSKMANKDFIEGAADQRVMMVLSGASLTLTGLTIQRTGTSIAQVLNNQGTLTVNNCVVQNGDTHVEGGVYNNGDLRVSGSTVKNNHAGLLGGGIFSTSAIGVTLTNTTVSGNNEVSLSQSTVQNNKATGNGGGVYSTARLGLCFVSSTISNNTAGLKGGGIYSSSRCLGQHSTISTNTATGVGGGVYSVQFPNEDNNNYLELSCVPLDVGIDAPQVDARPLSELIHAAAELRSLGLIT